MALSSLNTVSSALQVKIQVTPSSCRAIFRTSLLNIAKTWEAARATSAASSFFNSIYIGDEGFVDDASGANNPIDEVWSEARDIWREGAGWRL